MSNLPGLLYLNEARRIWCAVNPKLDIWAWKYPIEQGQLWWGAEHMVASDSIRLSRWFHLEQRARGKQRLIEKMPENVFRLRWLKATFPDAKFIHIIRHGRDVALSLATAVDKWFPKGYWATSRHYDIFREYAAGKPALKSKLDLLPTLPDNYGQSLLVWFVSVTEGREAGRELGPDTYLEIEYQRLIDDPLAELRRVYEFIQEPQLTDPAVQYAARIMRPDSLNKPDPAPAITKAIAGDLLCELGYRL